MLPKVQDVTYTTQQQTKGPTSVWQHEDVSSHPWPLSAWIYRLLEARLNFGRKEYIAVNNRSDDLIVFDRISPSHDWHAVNVSDNVNQQISTPVAAWSSHFGLSLYTDHIVGTNPNGHLLLLTRNILGSWTAFDISSITGEKVIGMVAIFKWKGIPSAYSTLLAGVSPRGELLVFYRRIWLGWRLLQNISHITGQRINGNVTSWSTPNGLLGTPHIAGLDQNGHLLVFSVIGNQGENWDYVDVSQITDVRLSGGLCSWITQQDAQWTEHVAARDSEGAMFVFSKTMEENWQAVNVTRSNCEPLDGTPSVYKAADHADISEALAFKNEAQSIGTGSVYDLLLGWWNPSTEWQSVNLSEATGSYISADPAAWTANDPAYNRFFEFAAATSAENKLLVYRYDKTPREMMATLAAPYKSLKFTRNKSRNVLVILWDWHNPAHTPPEPQVVEQAFFGSANSLNDYLQQISHGHFSINNAGVIGWYDADRDYTYYETQDTGDLNDDGFENQFHVKYKEAIKKAHEDGFDFSTFDTNPADGRIRDSELIIYIITPGVGDRGFVRPVGEREYPDFEPLYVNIGGTDYTFENIIDVYSGLTPNIGTIAHEIMHFAGHTDMYFEFDYSVVPYGHFMPYRAGFNSLMDNHSRATHIDPLAKIKFGWACPKLILRSGTYTFTDIETHYTVRVLMDPERTLDEYFLIENRWPGTSYDSNLPDSGLAIWHVMENSDVYGNLPNPPHMYEPLWDFYTDWGRRAIRLLRPVTTSGNNSKALWDGSDPETGYDLLSSDTNPDHTELRWGDGSESGFAIRNISAAGPEMHATVEVPF